MKLEMSDKCKEREGGAINARKRKGINAGVQVQCMVLLFSNFQIGKNGR